MTNLINSVNNSVMKNKNILCKCGCGNLVKNNNIYYNAIYIRGHFNRNKKFSQEHIEKIRIKNTGKKRSLQTKENIRNSHLGQKSWNKGMKEYIKLSDETKLKISVANKGKKHSMETRLKISKNNKGRKFTKEHKKKLSILRKGKKLSEKTKLKLSVLNLGKNNHFYGKKHSQKTRLKMRLSRIKYIEKCYGQVSPTYNIKSIIFFNKLNSKYNLNGIHAENGGEYYLSSLGYWLDFYSKKYNLIIEWDESHHYKLGKLKKRDEIRDLEIKNLLNCEIIRIKQNEDLNKYEENIKLYILNYNINKYGETA